MTAVVRDTLISAEENRRMFDQIAPRYDLLNGLMSLGLHRYWRRRAIRTLLAGGGRDFLDIGCGTGDVSRSLLRAAHAARVAGIDLSPEMLARAVAKTRAAGLEARATFQVGDAMAMSFADGSFDGIVCAFCFRNIVDQEASLREMRRVLRPGAPVVILELTKPQSPVLGIVHRLYTRRLIPLLGRILSQGSAYRYLADSIDHFPESPSVVAAMCRAGFANGSMTPLTGGFVTLFSGRAPGPAAGRPS